MHRPIGVTILAILAGIAGVFQLYAMLVYIGILKFPFPDREVAFQDPQWGAAFWSLILAAIWFWVAAQFWNVRAAGWTFGVLIGWLTVFWGFMLVLFGTVEFQTINMGLAVIVLAYLYWPGVRMAFYESEMSRLTPEQKAAFEQLNQANAVAEVSNAPGMKQPPVS